MILMMMRNDIRINYLQLFNCKLHHLLYNVIHHAFITQLLYKFFGKNVFLNMNIVYDAWIFDVTKSIFLCLSTVVAVITRIINNYCSRWLLIIHKMTYICIYIYIDLVPNLKLWCLTTNNNNYNLKSN